MIKVSSALIQYDVRTVDITDKANEKFNNRKIYHNIKDLIIQRPKEKKDRKLGKNWLLFRDYIQTPIVGIYV